MDKLNTYNIPNKHRMQITVLEGHHLCLIQRKTKFDEFPSSPVNVKMNKVERGRMRTQHLRIYRRVNSNYPHTYLHMELTLLPLLFTFLNFLFQKLYFDSNGMSYITFLMKTFHTILKFSLEKDLFNFLVKQLF
jgi:hypothetical protein